MRISLGGLAVIALVGCAEPSVVRVIDGHEVAGRYISEYAYALYARAAQQEAEGGDLGPALLTLEDAARDDPSSVEIRTRIGAIYCRAAGDVAKGEEALGRAQAIDPTYAPLYREQARCGLTAADREAAPGPKKQRLAAALAAAEQAMGLDPDDLGAARVAAELLSRLGRDSDARALLVAFTIRRPGSAEAFRALYQFGLAHRDEALVERAAARLRALGAATKDKGAAPSPLADIDAALARDDLPAAQRLAHKARLPLAELAVRAAALGRIALARSQAEVIVGADPSDTSARIAWAVAADLAGDTAAIAAALAGIPAALTAPSPLARLLFAEVLERRVGPETARAFLGADSPSAGDELHARIERRVRAKLSARNAPSVKR